MDINTKFVLPNELPQIGLQNRLTKDKIISIESQNIIGDQILNKENNNESEVENKIYNNSNNYPEKNIEIKNEENENSEEKKEDIHRRRSKNDIEGRIFICELCGKSYLSYPALYTHRKQKHNSSLSSGRGRGRPKKDISEQNIERIKFNPCSFNYFSKENRKGETLNYNNVIFEAFNFLYNVKNDNEKFERNKKRKMKEYNNVNEHPLLNKFLNNPHNKEEKIDDNENKITDDVFIDYLNKVSSYCNPDFFQKILIFVSLFREYINQIYSNKVDIGEEYTAVEKAEDVPDISNEFILDFINPEDNNNDFGFNKDECIDLIQNLCHWMYENNFTCSKLSMINIDNGK